MVQEYLENIKDGEISIVVVGEKVLHSVIKIPQENEFRIQCQFGGVDEPYKASEEEKKFALGAMKAVRKVPFYGRVDCVYNNEKELVIQELEIIDPQLWLMLDKNSAQEFGMLLSDFIYNNGLLNLK